MKYFDWFRKIDEIDRFFKAILIYFKAISIYFKGILFSKACKWEIIAQISWEIKINDATVEIIAQISLEIKINDAMVEIIAQIS